MGDMGEYWRDVAPILKENAKIRKASNIRVAIEKLDANNIEYRTKDDIHFIIREKIDYWPSTGKFIFRKSSIKGRGIFNLLKRLNENN